VSDIKRHYIDTTVMPAWGAGPDGRATRLDDDTRLPVQFAEWQKDACDHPDKATVLREDSLGRAQYYEHCKHCGMRLSSAISHAKVGVVSDMPAMEFDRLSGAYEQERRAQLDRIVARAAERCQGGNREAYDDYLRSDRWKRRSAKIMERAKGTCEGCLTNPATEVHHLTYAHIYQEFAFELVALCGACHDRIHKSDAA